MSRADDLILAGLKALRPKPPDTTRPEDKKNYSEQMSNALAVAVGQELRNLGMTGATPALPGTVGVSGAERRMAGGIGNKQVDVTWATEESGLILGVSVKTINFRDGRTGNFQKNLTNRRGDLLIEAVTLHRRFPYAVLVGLLFIDVQACSDNTARRKSTYENAHQRLKLFTGRNDPAGRDEQYERLYLVPVDANPFTPSYQCYEVGKPDDPVAIDDLFQDVVNLVVERNSDFYEQRPGEDRIFRIPGT